MHSLLGFERKDGVTPWKITVKILVLVKIFNYNSEVLPLSPLCSSSNRLSSVMCVLHEYKTWNANKWPVLSASCANVTSLSHSWYLVIFVSLANKSVKTGEKVVGVTLEWCLYFEQHLYDASDSDLEDGISRCLWNMNFIYQITQCLVPENWNLNVCVCVRVRACVNKRWDIIRALR